jgi:hypothetical protein
MGIRLRRTRLVKGGLRAAALGAGCLLVGASSASALVVGQAVTPGAATSCSPAQAALQTGVAAGGNPYAIPANGTLTSYSTRAFNPAGAGTKLQLVVFRPAGAGMYTVVGVSSTSIALPTSAPAADLTAATAPIPVQVGDIVGFWTDGSACALSTGAPGDAGADVVGAAPPTGTVTPTPYTAYLNSISATLAANCDLVTMNVGCWHFDEPSGTTAYDASGLGNNGTYVGGPTLGVTGVQNGGLGVDGVNDYVRVPDSASLHLGDSFLLVGSIRRTSDAKSQELFNKGANGFQVEVMNAANHDQVWLRKAGVTTIAQSTVPVPADGAYHEIKVLKNGTGPGSVQIAVDNNQGTGVTLVGPTQVIKDTTFPLTFGLVGGGPASLDEFAVYDR